MNRIYTLFQLFVFSISWSGVSAQAPYCTPGYNGSCSSNEGITTFQLGNINQDITCNGSPNAWYNFYDATSDFTIGSYYTLTVYAAHSQTVVDVWIDFNNNYQFDNSEKVIDGLICEVSNTNYEANLTIPANAPVGNHRLRFRTNRQNLPGDPCVTLGYGNAGDFIINLTSSPPGNASAVSPANGATNILPNTMLTWTPGSGTTPAGYYVYLGTDNPPSNIANGEVTSIPFYNPFNDLALNTTYYWKIVPYNSSGQASNAPVWSFSTISGYGSLQGFVTNDIGIPVTGVAVSATGSAVYNTLSDANGFYSFTNILPGIYTLSGQADSYNASNISGVEVNASNTTSQNLVLLQPGITILPNPANININPNEELITGFSVGNTGTGELTWSSVITYGSSNHDWFSMPVTSGNVSPSQNVLIPAVYNAEGLAAGDALNATVTFSSVPDIGTRVVQVNMIVSGTSLTPVSNLQETITDPLTGAVYLSWECTPSAGFLNYSILRNGIQIATVPSDTFYTDMLPDNGTFEYCLVAVYADGMTAPVCAYVEWAYPNLSWSPAQLIATVWPGQNLIVPLGVGNSGIGTLYYEFPDYDAGGGGGGLLSYCAATADNCDEFLGNVSIGTINNTSGCSGYTSYTSLTTDLTIGQTVAINVTNGGNAYSSDYVYTWIDYDHSGTFDASEYKEIPGNGAAFAGTITVPGTALSGPTTMRLRIQYGGTISPCGATPYGEVEDYSVNIHNPTFITSVSPVNGIVAAGGVQLIHTTFSATGNYSLPGTYTTLLNLTSNDMNHQSVNIPATMIVGIGGFVEGIITDCMLGPLNGVLVQAGTFSTMTNDTGYYSLQLNAGTYNVVFSKIGYQSVTSPLLVTDGNTNTLNTNLCETPYAPACAYASVNFEDTQCTVTWCLPAGPYEMLYDDGTAENYAAWLQPGNMNAVKFTPQGYPATVTGARFFIGDGLNGNSYGTSLKAEVYTSNANGLPGTMLDSAVAIVSNTGWVDVNGMNAVIASGDFFIVMIQNESAPDCPYLGVDETMPMAYKSYSRNISNGDAWGISPYQDFMIRAIVSSPVAGDDDKAANPLVTPMSIEGMISDKKPQAVPGSQEMKAMIITPENSDNANSVPYYSVSRVFLGINNPVPPYSGVFTLLNSNFTGTTYTDAGTVWNNLAMGWYAYGIRAIYFNMDQSDYTFTNIVPHKLFSYLTITVMQECGMVPAGGAIVKLTGFNYPYDVITDTIPASGTVTINQVIKGEYTLLVSYPGCSPYLNTVSLMNDQVLDVVLGESLYKPSNLSINNASLVATWEAPLSILLDEDFESGVYPPAGWQSTTQGMTGWYFTTNGSSASMPVPPHSVYAVTNDEQAGASNNGCCDYLLTPELNLTGASSYMLSFQSYYSGANGQLATVEMSSDNGISWTPVYTCMPSAGWQQVDIDLSPYSGSTGLPSVMFAFHADDAGNLASGWAVDDVTISAASSAALSYKVYLDGAEVGETTAQTWTYDPAAFTFGETYQAGVAAVYCTGISEPDTVDFSCYYLYPPQNLAVDTSITATSGAVILTWEAPLPSAANVVNYVIYRNDTVLDYVPATPLEFTDLNLAPGSYCYDITAVYDITAFGFPGILAESLKEGPSCVDIVYGLGFPFYEDFSSGLFDSTMWIAGQNWLVDGQSDNPVPAAKFKWDPLLVNYSSALESFPINATTLENNLPYKIWFGYEVKLDDQASSSTEKLIVEVWNDSSGWITAKEYLNTGSFDWTTEHLDITSQAKEQVFKVRFRANGSSSDGIQYWSVDNVLVNVEYEINPPLNLAAASEGEPTNNIRLTWDPPAGYGSNSIVDYKPDYQFNENFINAEGTSPNQLKNSNLFAGYDVYRRAYAVFPAGQNTEAAGEWTKIASVTETNYFDNNLSNLSTNCYEYHVKAVYTEGESVMSNIDWECIFVGLNPNVTNEVKVYPNPATNYVRIDLTEAVTEISVYNSLGSVVTSKNVKGETTVTINTVNYAAGAYSVKFTTTNGETFSRKFVVTK